MKHIKNHLTYIYILIKLWKYINDSSGQWYKNCDTATVVCTINPEDIMQKMRF